MQRRDVEGPPFLRRQVREHCLSSGGVEALPLADLGSLVIQQPFSCPIELCLEQRIQTVVVVDARPLSWIPALYLQDLQPFGALRPNIEDHYHH